MWQLEALGVKLGAASTPKLEVFKACHAHAHDGPHDDEAVESLTCSCTPLNPHGT